MSVMPRYSHRMGITYHHLIDLLSVTEQLQKNIPSLCNALSMHRRTSPTPKQNSAPKGSDLPKISNIDQDSNPAPYQFSSSTQQSWSLMCKSRLFLQLCILNTSCIYYESSKARKSKYTMISFNSKANGCHNHLRLFFTQSVLFSNFSNLFEL
jgi:hypothetical protein